MRIDNVDGESSLHSDTSDFRDGGPWACSVLYPGELNLLESRLVDLRFCVDDNYLILLMPICQSTFTDDQIEHASAKFGVKRVHLTTTSVQHVIQCPQDHFPRIALILPLVVSRIRLRLHRVDK